MTAHSPYAGTMGFTFDRDANGMIVVAMPWGTEKGGRPGFVHGGALAGLLETAAYVSVSDVLEDGDTAQVKPINITVSYMRGAIEATTYARATIERLGRRVANVEVSAWQDDPARPVAVAQLNIMLVRD